MQSFKQIPSMLRVSQINDTTLTVVNGQVLLETRSVKLGCPIPTHTEEKGIATRCVSIDNKQPISRRTNQLFTAVASLVREELLCNACSRSVQPRNMSPAAATSR